MKDSNDFIIIGGGSAGCTLANRLSENPGNRVLVLEAGRPDSFWDIFIHMPAGLTIPIGNPHYDWMYETQPEPFMNNRRITQGRGKLLGGSSSINGMIFQRGNPMDYERWANEPGMESWGYAQCLPYFKRMENCLSGANEFRGDSGPLKIERGPASTPLFHAFFEAVQQAGYQLTDDVNGFRQEGFAAFDKNVYRGWRFGAAKAYLHPIMKRQNLEVVCRAHVHRILFDGICAKGVEYMVDGKMEKASAKEIICSGGSINSPQLLQLSGIGAANELESLGIKVVHDLVGVGENLQDHLEVYVQHSCIKPVSMQPILNWWNKPWIGFQWLFLRRGPAATNHFEAGGFVRSNKNVDYPNLMFHFLPLAVRYDGSVPIGGHGYQVHVGPMYSNSRGSVKLKTNDPTNKPTIRFNYLSTREDRREWVEAIQCAREILRQSAFKEFNGGEISPGKEVETDDQILEWVALNGETAYHPSCSCKMGIGENSVLDPTSLRVHGLEGIRVIDASSMPYVPNANINAPTIMLAEKGADLVLGNTPLPSEKISFFHC